MPASMTLWASGSGQLWYSTEAGAVGSWVQVPPDPSWSLEMIGVCGPAGIWKVYTAVEGLGVASWNGAGWVTEYDTGGDGPWGFWRRPDCITLWCTDDDDLVIATGFGTNNDQIVSRQGSPGTDWLPDKIDTSGTLWYYQPYSVHGTPDGSEVFSIARDYANDDMVLLRRTPGTPLRTNLHSETGIDAVGDEEVRRSFVVASGTDFLEIYTQSVPPPILRAGVYLKLGSPPTSGDYDYAFSAVDGPNKFTIPNPGAGTWHILIQATGYWGGFFPPIWFPPEGFNDLSLVVDRLSGLAQWSVVARRSAATYDLTWSQLRVVDSTHVYIAGADVDSVSGRDLPRIWKWNGTTLSVMWTMTPEGVFDYTWPDCIGLWLSRDGTEGWACFHANDAANAYEKFIRFNGTSWSLFQEVTVDQIIHDVAQIDGDINSSRAIYGRGYYDIFNLLGDNKWPDQYGFTPPTRKVWPSTPIAVTLLYIDHEPPLPEPPYLDDQDPPAGSSRAPRGSSVKFSVLDDDGVVDPTTVVIRLDGAIVYEDEAAEPGYTVIRSVEAKGYRYEVIPDEEFDSYADVLVGVYAEDLTDEVLDTSYTFKMVDYLGCVITPIDPVEDEIGVPLSSLIVLKIEDLQSVVLDTVRISVDIGTGYQAAFDGESTSKFLEGFDGPGSSLVGELNNYTITLDPTSEFPLGTKVFISVNALDPEGNPPTLA